MPRKPTASQIAFSTGRANVQKRNAPLNEFEQLCKKLKIDPEDTTALVNSVDVRVFVHRFRDNKYVPLTLLSALRQRTQFDGDSSEFRVINPCFQERDDHAAA